MDNCKVGLVDPCYFERVGMRLYLKVTLLYHELGNIHGATTIDNHFHKSFLTPNKRIEDGGMFSVIIHDWIGQETFKNSKMCVMEKAIFNIDKIFKASLLVNNLFLKCKWLT